MLIYYSENPAALKNYAKHTLPVLYEKTKPEWEHICLQHGLLYICPLLRTTAEEEKERKKETKKQRREK